MTNQSRMEIRCSADETKKKKDLCYAQYDVMAVYNPCTEFFIYGHKLIFQLNYKAVQIL